MLDAKHCFAFFPKASKLFVMRRKHKIGCKHAHFFSRRTTQIREGVREQQLTSWKKNGSMRKKELTFERRIFVKFRDKDAHKDHLTNEVAWH